VQLGMSAKGQKRTNFSYSGLMIAITSPVIGSILRTGEAAPLAGNPRPRWSLTDLFFPFQDRGAEIRNMNFKKWGHRGETAAPDNCCKPSSRKPKVNIFFIRPALAHWPALIRLRTWARRYLERADRTP
jgi:hypothetical protein